MTTVKIILNEAIYKNASEQLEAEGYSNDGVEVDKRGKKHQMYSKDGIDYEFKGVTLGSEKIITLETI